MSVPINHFVPRNSVIHNFDPRLKFLSYLILLTMIFLWPANFFLYFFYLFFYIFLFKLAKLQFRHLRPILFSLFLVFIFLFLFNLININLPEHDHEHGLSNETDSKIGQSDSEHDHDDHGHIHEHGHDEHWFTESFQLWIIKFNWSVITRTIFYTLRIFLVIFLTFIFSSSTSSYEITFAISSLLSPLKLIGFPVVIFATIISLTLRLVPTLVQEGKVILDAQSSRGLDFQTSKFITKIKISIALIIPLLVSIFKKAGEMANAMESRGYNPNKTRTTYQQFAIRPIDWFIFLFIILFLVSNILFISLIMSNLEEGGVFEEFFHQINESLDSHEHDD